MNAVLWALDHTAVVLGAAWCAISLAVGVLLGRAIALADERENRRG